MRLLTTICALLFFMASCNHSQTDKISGDAKVSKLKLPAGFHADHLYGPSDNGEGSWVAMTFDDKGRLIASDQYGGLYRMEIPAIGSTGKVKVEKLDLNVGQDTATYKGHPRVNIGYAHGLLYAFHSLYVMINHTSDSEFNKGSGLYRLQDTDGDDKFDKMTLLKALDGEGEHGPHSIVLSPDKKSLYVIAGNFTRIPKTAGFMAPPVWQIDNLLPLIRDPNGHDDEVNTHGGWIANVDSAGATWKVISSGFRNPFDLTFNEAGDMFTFDSDMEWDFGLPWYRPIRICQVPSGGEFGWRPGDDKWSPSYPDNLPPLVNIGQGSPTNIIYGGNARFPEKYKQSLLAFDWSFGIIYSIHLQSEGASYKAQAEEFVSGSPLPLTDGVIGPDGALYFMTGGRQLESDVYRVYYEDNTKNQEPLRVADLTEDQKIRRKLETFHGHADTTALAYAWPYLRHSDRFIRFAARIAVENQPVDQWEQKALQEKDPVRLTQAAIALARQGKPAVKDNLLRALTGIQYTKLTVPQQIDLLRAFELVLIQMGMPSAPVKNAVSAYLNPFYPASSNEGNRELSKILVYLEAPHAVEKTMALLAIAKDDTLSKSASASSDLILRNFQYGSDIAEMLANVPPAQQTYYAVMLSDAKTGWTPELRNQYFAWFYKAFGFKGGHSFVGFIDLARKRALKNVPKENFAYFNTLSGDSLVGKSGTELAGKGIQPKGPGEDWTMDKALPLVKDGLSGQNFERGKAMFAASFCGTCHTMRGQGGVVGPDLTQVGTRFSYKDMLESIIDPSKTISDQFAATVFYLTDGTSVVGRLMSQDADKYSISQNPFAPQTLRDIPKKDVQRTRLSETSIMLPGLMNRLNADEVKDLLAYLKAGGNPKDPIFSSSK